MISKTLMMAEGCVPYTVRYSVNYLRYGVAGMLLKGKGLMICLLSSVYSTVLVVEPIYLRYIRLFERSISIAM